MKKFKKVDKESLKASFQYFCFCLLFIGSILFIIALPFLIGYPYWFGNKKIIKKYKYNAVHIIEEHRCYEITSWSGNSSSSDNQINNFQVVLENGTILNLNTQIAFLVSGSCPVCDKGE